MSLSIGLSGGIASGKSTVAQLFAELGITVIDADLIAREVVLPDTPGLNGIIELFGTEVLSEDGTLDRKQLRNLIFSDPDKKKELNGLLHPMIGQRMLQRSNDAPGPYHLLDIPLLVEGEWRDRVDRVLIVDCTVETQIRRVCTRDNETRESALRIINSQTTKERRLEAADDVIDNNGETEALAPQVYRLHQCYLNRALAQSTE
ncbi:MAG: dephospho-CoA kinase [Gammaproteobacteria bacterium]